MTSTTMQLHAALIWGGEPIADVLLAKPGPITIGPDASATFTVPDLGLPEVFPIVSPGERGYLLTMGSAMAGTVSVGGVRKRVTDLVGEAPFAAMPVGAGDWGVVDLDGTGGLQLFFQVAPAAEKIATKRPWDLDTLLPAAAFSVVLHVLLLFATFVVATGESPFVWPGARSLTGSYLVTRLAPPPPPPPPSEVKIALPPPPQPANEPPDTQVEPPKKRLVPAKGHEGDDGGQPTPTPSAAEVGLNSPESRRLLKQMTSAGVDLGKFSKKRGHGSGKAGTGPGSGGDDLLPGTPDGEDAGVGHKQQGDIDTKQGAHKEPGKGGGGDRRPVDEVIVPSDDKVIVDGTSLDPAEINKRIQHKRGLFGACYQRALNRDERLGGTITATFTIKPDGSVGSIKLKSSISNAEVSSCVQRNLRSIRFPTSSDGGIVHYPFAFNGGAR